MATDGVKIIDSDLAHDTYTEILRLFDEGKEPDEIRSLMPLQNIENEYYDEFDYEILVTSYALGMWQIGGLTSEIITKVKLVLETPVTVKIWTEEYDPRVGNARKRVLEKFWTKINSPNPSVRRRQKFKTLITPIFEENSLLAFPTPNGNYHVCLCSKVFRTSRKASYTFVFTTYKDSKFPELKDIMNLQIWGTRIASGGNPKSASEYQPGVENLWKLFPEPMEHFPENKHFIVGLCERIISHKDLVLFSNKFTKIGILKIKDQFNRQGSAGFFNTLDRVIAYCLDLAEGRYVELPINLICEI